MLFIFSSNPFYAKYVCLPQAGDPIPPEICQNPKFWPYFKDEIGALDGSHIHSAPPANERGSFRNRKGFISQNCLFGCSFNLRFVFAYTGWEGSATDSLVYENALQDGFKTLEGKYYLADARFPSCKELLIPYRAVRYHLAEWGRANTRCILRSILQAKIHILIVGPKTRKNFLIFATHLPEMLLNEYLES